MPVRLPLSGWSAWIVVAGLLIAKEGSHAWSDEWGLVKRSCLLHHQVELDFSPFYKTKNNSKITYIDKKCIHKWLKLCIHSQLYHFPPQNWKVKRKIILLFFPLVTENKAQKRKKKTKNKNPCLSTKAGMPNHPHLSKAEGGSQDGGLFGLHWESTRQSRMSCSPRHRQKLASKNWSKKSHL